MLRIIQNSNAAGAKGYYTTADYYGMESPGIWRGKAAEMLGLSGIIEKDDWESLCDNLHPKTGKAITQRTQINRTVGYDLNFHAPKSLSILYALDRDEAIRSAFQEAVHETMLDIEADAEVRVRKAGRMTDRKVSNLVWGEYIHETSRPVEGVSDPHLHIHAFVMNVAKDPIENVWKSVQFRGIKESAPYYQNLFHSRLAEKMQQLGYATVRTSKGWELAGISEEMRDKFSRRTQLIESLAEEKGIHDPAQKAELGAKTRERKQKNLSPDALWQEWRNRLTSDEHEQLAQVSGKQHSVIFAGDAAQKATRFAVEHCFERSAVVPERTLIAEALKQGVGQVNLQQINVELNKQGIIRREYQGKRMATTKEILAMEQHMIQQARMGRGQCTALCPDDQPIHRTMLNEDQQKAVRHIWESNDKVILVRGAAGVGKTTLLMEAKEGIEAHGKKVFAFAPTINASRVGLRAEGFENAETVARLLIDENLQRQIANQVMIVDEAALTGTRDLAKVVDLAVDLNARLILVGDIMQHKAVQHGTGMRLLETEAGLKTAKVKEIMRQKGQYKDAVAAFSEGKVEKGLDILDELNWIIEDDSNNRYSRLAKDYVASFKKGKKVLAIAPTNAEKQIVSDAIRSELREQNLIDTEERQFTILKNLNLTEAEKGDRTRYEPGMVIKFSRNVKGHQSGEKLIVDDLANVPIEHAKHFQVFRSASLALSKRDLLRITSKGTTKDGKSVNNGTIYSVKEFTKKGDIVLNNGMVLDKNWGLIDSGWTSTSYSAQGKTIDNTVFVAQSDLSLKASSTEQLYVSASRAKEKVLIYCESKSALRDSVSRCDERLAASDLLDKQPMKPVHQTTRWQKWRLLARHVKHKLESLRQEPKQKMEMNYGR